MRLLQDLGEVEACLNSFSRKDAEINVVGDLKPNP